jgi:F-type H+-transporting ATPase subunit delta
LAHEGRLHAVVSSAFALTPKQQQQIQADLAQHYGKPVDIEVRVDPELIGGVKIAVGDDVIDASVRSKLAKMAAALKI